MAPVRVGVFSAAHLHVWSYLTCLKENPRSQVIGMWDDDLSRLENISASAGVAPYSSLKDLLENVDAVVICSENVRHAEMALPALQAGKHVLCEKPLVVREEDGIAMVEAARASGAKLMTAFPCRFSPAYQRLKQAVQSGELGKVLAIQATNRGTCPGDWFVQKEKSGGGAMIDHTVHVADLLRDLLGEEPVRVQAQIGSNMYGQEWDDTAMVTLEYPSGVFATLDSSWSRPKAYKTWGDVTMTVTGTRGVLEMDMFGQELDVFLNKSMRHTVAGFGSNLDGAMVDGFLRAIQEGGEVPVTGEDGLAAARVALAAYRSVGQSTPASV